MLPDFSTITSGDTIGFLDPHKHFWPGESGQRYPLRTSLPKIPGLKSQYEVLDVLGCNVSESADYNGTLFRFPLRQRGPNSEISSSVWDTDRVLDVVYKSFQEDAHPILLFLKSVEKISLYHWIPPNRKPHTIFQRNYLTEQYVKYVQREVNYWNVHENFLELCKNVHQRNVSVRK